MGRSYFTFNLPVRLTAEEAAAHGIDLTLAELEVETQDDVTTSRSRPIDAYELAQKLLILGETRRLLPFAAELSDPGWYMLLHLFWREKYQLETSVSKVCKASLAPQTTALRYLESLVASGWVERTQCEYDARMRLVKLAPVTSQMLRTVLNEIL